MSVDNSRREREELHQEEVQHAQAERRADRLLGRQARRHFQPGDDAAMNGRGDTYGPPEEGDAHHGEEGSQRIGERQEDFHDGLPFVAAHHVQLFGEEGEIQAGGDHDAQDEGQESFFRVPFFLRGDVHAAYTGSAGGNCQTLS